jgi:hypothetical protein
VNRHPMNRHSVMLTAAAAAVAGLLAGSATQSGVVASASRPAPGSAEARGCDLPGPYDYPRADEPVDLDPSDFSARIDHPYFPMRPGTVWTYRETDGQEVQRIRVTVLQQTKLIRGIRARVVRDVVRSGGALVEDTFDWYAQDSGGSIWYLGEATKEYEDGEFVSTEGSWEHGRNGAQAGLLLPARPKPGCAYREEYLAGEAEDRAVILAERETLKVPTGRYRRVLHTTNSTPLVPDILENKFYARGVGPVAEVDISPHFSRAVLLSVTRP